MVVLGGWFWLLGWRLVTSMKMWQNDKHAARLLSLDFHGSRRSVRKHGTMYMAIVSQTMILCLQSRSHQEIGILRRPICRCGKPVLIEVSPKIIKQPKKPSESDNFAPNTISSYANRLSMAIQSEEGQVRDGINKNPNCSKLKLPCLKPYIKILQKLSQIVRNDDRSIENLQ